MPKNKGGGGGGGGGKGGKGGGSKGKGAEGGDAQPKQSKGGTAVKAPKMRYRSYCPTSMLKAIEKVRLHGVPIRTTAREFGIPESSLRHKLSGRVDPEATRSGTPPMFSLDEESLFVDHLKFMVGCGYSFSRAEVVSMATEYAVCLGKRDSKQPLSFKWYSGFMTRWPDLKVLKPRGLEVQRAEATAVDCLNRYYTELDTILTKYKLHNKPERIYVVDEKVLSVSQSHLDSVTDSNSTQLASFSSPKQTVTLLGCGNANGSCIPPYFVFPGAYMKPEQLEGGSAGADGDVTDSGFVNSLMFLKYIEQHFMKYLPECSADNPALVLYDGHLSYINLELIEWANRHHIILFILPAHTSHVLQPSDTVCFGPFDRFYSKVCHKFLKDNCDQSITCYNICSLGSSAYLKALMPDYLPSLFCQAGIHPYNPSAVNPSNFKSSNTRQRVDPSTIQQRQTSQELSLDADCLAVKKSCLSVKKSKKPIKHCFSTVVEDGIVTDNNVIDLNEDQTADQHKKAPKLKIKLVEPQPGPSEVKKLKHNPTDSENNTSSSEDGSDN